MRSALLMPTFLCLFLLSVTIESRKDLQEYWVNSKVHEKFAEGFKRDYKESLVTNTLDVIEKKVSTEEFEPAYGDNENKKYKKDFEPRPSATKYGDDSYKLEKHSVNSEFEPRPSATKYGDDTYKSGKLSLNYEFEPRPSITKYDNHHGYKSDKLPLNSEFEPRPSATKYGDDDYKNEKMQVDDEFEPRPSATKYDE